MEAIADAIELIFFILACMLCLKGFTFLYYKDFTVKSVGAYVIFVSIITITLLWNPILRGLLHG